MKRILSILPAFACALLCLVLALCMRPLTVAATATIDKVSLTLAYPEAGKTPPMTATSNGTGYSVYDIEWYDWEDGHYLEAGEKIQAGRQYAATIWVEARDGYAFKAVNDNTPDISATVNGESTEAAKAYEYKAWAMVTLQYSFAPVPPNGWITSVELTIPAPVAGATPFYDQIRTASYSTKNVYFNDFTDPKMKNGISWYNTTSREQIDPNNAETFAANTSYEFHCLIFPEENYCITDNAVVRVNGKLAEAYLDYGTFLSVKYAFPATGAAFHTHFYTDWAWNSGQHYKNCTDCDEVFFVESHKGGVATCEEDGTCTVCGYAYIKAGEEYHTPDTTKWLARAEMYHFHKCSICGAHCDIEEHKWSPKYHGVDAKGHAYQCADCMGYDTVKPHTPGPAATDTTPQTCTECGFVITPAGNHIHKLTKVTQVPATCTEDGVIEHYTCVGCADRFTDPEGKTQVTSLAIGALGHDMKDGNCSRCGYSESVPVETTDSKETTEATQPTEPTGAVDLGEKEKKNGWLAPVLIGLVCFAAAITATVILLKRKKQ